MDTAVCISALQRSSKSPTLDCALRANKLVKWIKRKKTQLTFKPLQGKLRVTVVGDSAFKRDKDSALAMRGSLIAISECHDAHPGGMMNEHH